MPLGSVVAWLSAGGALFALAIVYGWWALISFIFAWVGGAVALPVALRERHLPFALVARFLLYFVATTMFIGLFFAAARGSVFGGLLAVSAIAGGMIGDRALARAKPIDHDIV